MSDPHLKAELEALKAQVQQMAQKAAPSASAPEQAGAAASPLEEVRKFAEGIDAPELMERASEYLKGLGQDVNDSKPRALIAAFVAGYLAGRIFR